jgi:hypothetical protein
VKFAPVQHYLVVRDVQPWEAFYEQSGFVPSKVDLRRLALCNFLPLTLLAFWLWPTGQTLCVIFDEWLFQLLNAPLGSYPIWLRIWAIASLRPVEVVRSA